MVKTFMGMRDNNDAAPRRVRIRQTATGTAGRKAPSVMDFACLRREEALVLICRYLGKHPAHPMARALIDLFQIHGEELTETGIPYEVVQGLARRYPLLHCLRD